MDLFVGNLMMGLNTNGVKRKHSRVIQNLNNFFDKTKAKKANGQLICEQDVQITGI